MVDFSPLFTRELKKVYPAQSLDNVTIDPTNYAPNEFSVSGFDITAGSNYGAMDGARAALDAMNFGHFSSMAVHTYLPANDFMSGVIIPKRKFALQYTNIFEAYGRGNYPDVQDPTGSISFWDTQTADWIALNRMNDDRFPSGHNWGSLILSADVENSVFANNPSYWIRHNENRTGPTAFNCYTAENPDPYGYYPSLSVSERAAMVDAIAGHIHRNTVAGAGNALNASMQISLDPSDGDLYATDMIMDLNDEIAERLATFYGYTNVTYGLYAYANHRQWPTNSHPRAYVKIATAFNDLGVGYLEMMRQWALKVGHGVGERGYNAVAAWHGYTQFGGGVCRRSFMDAYPEFRDAGMVFVNAETGHDHIKNVVGQYAQLMWCRDGVSTFGDALDLMMPRIFNDDPAIRDYYEMIAEGTSWNAFNLKDMGEIIQGMRESTPSELANKRLFEQYFTVYGAGHYNVTPNGSLAGTYNNQWTQKQKDKYFSKLEKNLQASYGIGLNGGAQSYAIARRLANRNASDNGRPDLAFDQRPAWALYPQAPTRSAFSEQLTALQKAVSRPVELDWNTLDDLCILQTAPTGAAATFTTPHVYFDVREGEGDMFFVGSGTVHIEDLSSGKITDVVYPIKGIHTFTVQGSIVRWTPNDAATDFMCMSLFPEARLDTGTGSGFHWLYMPDFARGNVQVFSDVRLTVYDHNGRTDITGAAPETMQPGVWRSDGNTRGKHGLIGINQWVSSHPDRTLVTKATARAVGSGVSLLKAA